MTSTDSLSTSVNDMPLPEALRTVPVFSDLSDEEMQWLVERVRDERYQVGDIVIREGDPADRLLIILAGEARGRREALGPDSPIYMGKAGQLTGMLPFSRMTEWGVTSRVTVAGRIATLHRDYFPELLQRIPRMLPRMVGILSDRVREVTKVDQQRDRLAGLGKLAAGLAHELNNPASAARRASEALREVLAEQRKASCALDRTQPSPDQRACLSQWEDMAIRRLNTLPELDGLTRSDREDELSRWLVQCGVKEPWQLASSLVDAGFTTAELASVVETCSPPAAEPALRRVAATVMAERLSREIDDSSRRVSHLVQAVKDYTYMDQAPEQEVDIQQGLESTLTILQFRLKQGVKVTRQYEPNLPRVVAIGSELNQVWTNLIENALDAMGDQGELVLRTYQELDQVVVEVVDNGPGIPEAIASRVFDPFFTTKPVGQGIGLGLDSVRRTVRRHRGEVQFESQPGRTCFQVRLPAKR